MRRLPLRYALLSTIGLLTLGPALVIGAVTASAQTPAKVSADPAAAAPKYDPTKPYPPYTAPRLKIGQPDLQGTWSNSTLTPMTRKRDVADRAVYTEDEVRALEQAMVDEIEEGLKPDRCGCAGGICAAEKSQARVCGRWRRRGRV